MLSLNEKLSEVQLSRLRATFHALPLFYASVNFSCPEPPLRATAGYLPVLLVPGWGICQPRGHSGAFDTHAEKQIGSSVKDRKRVENASCRFYACISSLLIKPELRSEIQSYRCESTFFGYWIKFLFILFEEHTFIFIKLFITYNFTALHKF